MSEKIFEMSVTINHLKELYSETPNLSFHKVAQILQVSSTLVRVTLNFDLKLNTYFQIWPENYP